LIGQILGDTRYTNLFKAVVLQNPNLDLQLMFNYTHFDFHMQETVFGEVDLGRERPIEDQMALWDASAISRVEKWQAACQFILSRWDTVNLGLSALKAYRNLKRRGVPSEVVMYDT